MAKKKGPYVEIIGKWKHECDLLLDVMTQI